MTPSPNTLRAREALQRASTKIALMEAAATHSSPTTPTTPPAPRGPLSFINTPS